MSIESIDMWTLLANTYCLKEIDGIFLNVQMTREVSDAIAIQGSNNLDGASLHSVGSPMQNFSYVNVSDSERDAHLHNFHQNGHSEETARDDAATPLQIDLLPGEVYEDSADFDDSRVVLTNFRLCIISRPDQSIAVISLMSIEYINFTDPVQLSVVCRDGKVYRLSAPTNELAIHWHKRLMKVPTRSSVGEAFAWNFASAVASSSTSTDWLVDDEEKDYCQAEWKLLDFDPDFFKIMDDNLDFSFSETYPRRIVVPKMDRELLALAKDYRFLGRFPAVVYVFKETKAVMLRSSQPKCGFLNWRCVQDEQILEEVNKFTAKYSAPGVVPSNVIMDARSYAAAWANRAKGGGFENPDCYGTNTKSTFLGLPNIHNVRYAFVQLRNVLSTEKTDQNTYLQSISTTNWLQYLGGVISAANECVSLLSQGTSVLVHCSDGWDRTSQIVSLAKLLADERYRTIEGFELLVRREWIEFGHKFADRNAVHGNDTNERCPVFLQWLDAVCQCYKQHPTAFEFNQQYIIKLAQHAYSGLFGTFLFNSMSEAAAEFATRKGAAKPISIWQFLGRHNEEVVNQDYDSCITGKLVVQSGIQNLQVWREFYCTEASGNYGIPEGTAVLSSPALGRTPATSPMKDSTSVMVKSKSSESISSLGNPDALAPGTLAAAHSESNGTLNTVGADHHVMESSVMGESMLLRRDARSHSLRSRKPRNIKDLVDNDGMIKFCDPQQEIQRRKNRKHKDELKKKDDQLTNMQRKRSSSEKTNYSLRSRDRMVSGDLDSEFDNMSMDRAMSDMSLVDNNDVVLPASSGGWSVNQDACALCKMQFSALSLKPEDRKHHCRQCGKTVCDACSKYTYHQIHEGRGMQVRACKDCYALMSAHSDDILNEEDEENTSMARPRSRTDTIMRVADDSPFRFNTTQTVKG